MIMRVVTMRTRTTIKSSNDLQWNPLTAANGDGAFMSFPIVMFNLGDSQGVPLVVNKISTISLTCNPYNWGGGGILLKGSGERLYPLSNHLNYPAKI